MVQSKLEQEEAQVRKMHLGTAVRRQRVGLAVRWPVIMLPMANHAYASLWCKDYSEFTMLEFFERLLKTVPFSAEKAGFVSLVIRAVRPTETPLVEQDLRCRPLDAAELIEVAREHLHRDSAYEVRTHYDLWAYDFGSGRWQLRSQPIEITCNGPEYD
jgi:hypothetical protein